MFYDNAYNTPNYNYFAFNKLITSAGYGYGLPAASNLYHHMHLQQQQQQLHQQPTQPYDDIFTAIPTPYIANNGLYVMEDYYQLANKLKRYRPTTIDRNEYLNGLMTGADKLLPNDATYHDLSNKKYNQKQLHHIWKKCSNEQQHQAYKQQPDYSKLNHVRPSRSTTTTAVARNKKPSAKNYENSTNSKYSYENQYAKYYEAITNTNQPIATTTSTKPTKSSKTTQTFKQSKSGEFESSLKQQQQPYQQHQRMPRSVRIKSEYSSKLINKSLSSDASKSRLTETNSCKSSCSSTKSSDRCGNTPDSAVEVLPPPPPPLPPIDLFKPIDNSFLFKRKKKLRKPLLVNDSVDEIASKSFDAVVDELKFKLEKMRTSDDNLSRLNTLLNKTNSNSSKPATSILVDTKVATLAARPALATVAKASEADTISTIYSSNFKAKTPITKQKLFMTEKSDMEKTQSNSSIFSASLKSIYTNNVTKDTHSKSLDTNSKLSGLSSCKNRNGSCSSFDSRDSSLQQPQLPQQQISQPFKTPTNKSIKTNSVKFTDQQFKLEIYDSNGDESDDYTKYTRLKFTPTPNKIEVCAPAVKFIDEKINYTSNSNEYCCADPASSKTSSVNGASSSKKADTAKKLEFFTQNLFVTHNKKTFCSSAAPPPSCSAPTATATVAAENGEKNTSSKLDQYRNEFKETVKPMPVGQFFKIVKKQQPASNQSVNNLVNEPAKSIGAGPITGSDDTSSSGIDSSNYLNSDDDLNNNSSSNKSIIIKTSSLENFLIPSKFSSFTDYNVAKSRKLLSSMPINSSKNNVTQTTLNTPPNTGNNVICVNRDELPMTKLKTTLEFNNLSEYNKLCDQISDYVTLQNNYFGDTDGFELATNDNQMLNKYLNEMTNYYQNLNSQELELANFNE